MSAGDVDAAEADALAEARRRRGWIDLPDLLALRDDGARLRELRGLRAVMATFAGLADEDLGPALAALALAQAAGVPCVVVERPGVAERVRHGASGYVSRSADETHLRAAVAKLCRDDVLWARMRRAALTLSARPASSP